MTDVGTATPPPKKGMKRKKSLTQFVVMSKVEMGGNGTNNNKAKQQYARDENTQEFYLLTHKCSVCGSQESVGESSEGGGGGGGGVINTTATTTTTSSVETSDVESLERKIRNDWLSEKDENEIDKIREGEGHHNRIVRRKEEVTSSRHRKKLGLLGDLKIQATTREECDRRIAAAVEKGDVSVNLNAFLITSDGVLRPFNAQHGGCLYERVRNKHRDELIDIGRLHVDMLAHQEAFKQLFHLFLYLAKQSPPIDYLIYKRPIELLDGKLIDTLDVWDRLENLFDPKLTGYYYAIIGCVGFYLPADK